MILLLRYFALYKIPGKKAENNWWGGGGDFRKFGICLFVKYDPNLPEKKAVIISSFGHTLPGDPYIVFVVMSTRKPK